MPFAPACMLTQTPVPSNPHPTARGTEGRHSGASHTPACMNAHLPSSCPLLSQHHRALPLLTDGLYPHLVTIPRDCGQGSSAPSRRPPGLSNTSPPACTPAPSPRLAVRQVERTPRGPVRPAAACHRTAPLPVVPPVVPSQAQSARAGPAAPPPAVPQRKHHATGVNE